MGEQVVVRAVAPRPIALLVVDLGPQADPSTPQHHTPARALTEQQELHTALVQLPGGTVGCVRTAFAMAVQE